MPVPQPDYVVEESRLLKVSDKKKPDRVLVRLDGAFDVEFRAHVDD
jgi:hypothetical protein